MYNNLNYVDNKKNETFEVNNIRIFKHDVLIDKDKLKDNNYEIKSK